MNEKSINIIIPMPPSINTAYAGYPKRHKSNEYKQYEKIVWLYLKKEKFWIEWDKWLNVIYDYYFPLYNKDWTKKIKDVWNYEKCLTDTLCKNIKWFEDHKILNIKMSKNNSEKSFVKVTIYEN